MGRGAGVIGWVMRSIDRVRDGYGAVVARLVRISVIGLVMVGVASAGVWALAKKTPTGFLPEDDQGAFFVVAAIARRRLARIAPMTWCARPRRS